MNTQTSAEKQNTTENTTDYLIVGAGSAGCVLANRLSASGKHRVTLLEAGGSDKSFWIKVPIGYGRTFFDPKVNWKYETEPDPALQNRSSYWPRGKVLGGSSSINAMVYIRGHRRDFDDWAEKGNAGWDYESVLPYFVKAEDSEFPDSKFHHKGGQMHVSRIEDRVHPLCNTYLDAARQYGLPVTEDFNGADMEGAGIYSITTKNGVRESTASAYLDPARRHKSLSIITRAHVEKILIDENKRATGVSYLRDGKRVVLHATQEVIVCAGSVNSPQLLELSGIGDEQILSNAGIQPVHVNPNVGQHLQDHLGINYVYRSRVPTLNDELHSWFGKAKAGIRYLLTRKGHLSMSVNQSGGFVRSTPDKPHPNLQLYFAALSYSTATSGTRPLMNPDPYSAYILSFQPCRPTSRGSIHIKSADAMQPPVITPNYLSTNEDISEIVEGCHLMRELVKTPALAEITESELEPGDSVQTDEQLLDDFRARSGTVFHPIGTCTMGPDPATAVVDPELKVYGIKGLRVVDASVFPNLTSGNTNAPTIMVAEKAADSILAASRE